MPSKLRTTYTYECSICHQEYHSSESEEAVRAFAVECERKGTPFIHRLQLGTKVKAVTTDPLGSLTYQTDGGKIEIMGCFFERKTHRPMYHVKFSDVIEHSNFPAENIQFRTVIYRFTSAAALPSGKVLMSEHIVSSMEPSF